VAVTAGEHLVHPARKASEWRGAMRNSRTGRQSPRSDRRSCAPGVASDRQNDPSRVDGTWAEPTTRRPNEGSSRPKPGHPAGAISHPNNDADHELPEPSRPGIHTLHRDLQGEPRHKHATIEFGAFQANKKATPTTSGSSL